MTNNNLLKMWAIVSVLGFVSLIYVGCAGEDGSLSKDNNKTGGDGDTDTDGDSDSDGDSDGDSDSDGDISSDGDSDADGDGDGDVCDVHCVDDCNAAGGVLKEGVCEAAAQQCCIIDTGDADSDADGDSDSDGDTDAEGDGGMTLYYIRHAETVANTLPPEEMTYEATNEWSTLGQSQVDALTDWLMNSGKVPVPDAVLVSPTWRGQFTISPYLVAMDMQGEIWPELTEVDEEPVTGDSIPTEVEPEEYFKYAVEADNLTYRDGAKENALLPEGFEQGLSVVMMARDLLLERYGQSGKTVFISGHAHAGRLLMGLLGGHDMVDDNPENFAYALFNTGVTQLEQDPDSGVFEIIDSNMNDPEGAPSFDW
ncbi:MAG: phosphoglycerate mutase family protein [Deltaproteobacteria bacterium]|nr:phosphoglycerate mutase family protein [Deltaproteobacteria bacterium]